PPSRAWSASSFELASVRLSTGSSRSERPSCANQPVACATASSGPCLAAAVGTTNAGPGPAAAASNRSCSSLPGLNSSPPTSASRPACFGTSVGYGGVRSRQDRAEPDRVRTPRDREHGALQRAVLAPEPWHLRTSHRRHRHGTKPARVRGPDLRQPALAGPGLGLGPGSRRSLRPLPAVGAPRHLQRGSGAPAEGREGIPVLLH